jgi:hypothetical protein
MAQEEWESLKKLESDVEVVIRGSVASKHQLWRDFLVAAVQAIRMSQKAYKLEHELEGEG